LSAEIKSWLLISIFVIFLIPTSYVAKADEETSWEEESKISVSIVGNAIINLDSNNKLLRAYVDIVNHDPGNGYYFLRVIQSATDKIISEEEIIIREKSNDKAGADIAHMFNEEEISINGTAVLGDYEIEVFSQNGNAIGTTTFSIIKPSVSSAIQMSEITEDIDNTSEPVSVEESVENESQLENTQEIPDWVKNTATWWADGLISDQEFANAVKFLVTSGIVQV